jgi:predicted nucleotidyltransferase
MGGKFHLDIPKDKIADFCRRWKIMELDLFGSILRDDFRPDSDVDVLVEFYPDVTWSLFDLVTMQDELAAIFGRKVDVVELSAVRNPFRRREIERTRQVLFAA